MDNKKTGGIAAGIAPGSFYDPDGDGFHENGAVVVEWDDGTTEPGSSGSPLFDNNYQSISIVEKAVAQKSSLPVLDVLLASLASEILSFCNLILCSNKLFS